MALSRSSGKTLETTNYQLVLFIGAKTVFEETLTAIKTPKVLWFMDGVKYYPELIEKFRLFDHLFIFEPTDKELLVDFSKDKISTLDLGFNKNRFYPKKEEFIYDFSFIGSYYKNREETLIHVVNELKNGIIIGDFNKSNNKKINSINWKSQITIDKTNTLFNQSRNNINIHHSQSIEGLNVRTFEILGSGNLQFVENKKNALNFFEDGKHLVFYSSKEELVDKQKFYLNNEIIANKIRENGYKVAIKHHTWKNRLEYLLKTSKFI